MPKVLFIPGLPGSELRSRQPGGSSTRVFPPSLLQMVPSLDSGIEARLRGPDSLTTDDGVFAARPIRVAARFLGFDLMKQAESLYDLLDDLGVGGGDRLELGWDWRRPVTDDTLPTSARPALAALLAAQAVPVTVIAHSTGGMLLRHCLERQPALAAKVAKVIAYGVPWAGTLKPLAVLVGRQGFGPVSATAAQRVFARVWAAFDLLPRANGARLVLAANGQETDLLADTAWMDAIPNDASGALAAAMRLRAGHSLAALGTPAAAWNLPVEVVNVVGWGKRTLVRAVVRSDGTIDLDPADLDNEAGDAAEGASAATAEDAYEGDGTVPVASAAWLTGPPRVRTYFVPIGAVAQVTASDRRHSELWRNPGAKALLAHHLSGAPAAPLAYAAVDWSDKLDPGAARIRIRIVMQDPTGAPLPGAAPRVRTTGDPIPGAPHLDPRRWTIEANRTAFPKTSSGTFQRVVVELPWDGDPAPKPQAMFITP